MRSETLAKHSPQLVTEWSDRNGDFTPEKVTYGSNKKAWWRGRCGHEWLASIKNRVSGAGCPYCSGNKLLTGFNDLHSRNPELVKEWSFRNTQIADAVIAYSNKKAWWKCCICGGEWEARIADRMSGSGCPYCSFAKIQAGINDFATYYPELSEEWSARNGKVQPQQISAKVRYMAWWKCKECGHEWRAMTNTRARGSGCPACRKQLMICRQRRKRKLKESFPHRLTQMSVWYYATRDDIPFLQMDDREIGIPIMAWFPEKYGAIESEPRRNNSQGLEISDKVKDTLCQRAGIRLVRLLHQRELEHKGIICIRRMDETVEALSQAVRKAFEIIGYDVDVDIGRDIVQIQEYYLSVSQ